MNNPYQPQEPAGDQPYGGQSNGGQSASSNPYGDSPFGDGSPQPYGAQSSAPYGAQGFPHVNGQQFRPMPENYLWFNILATLFCCLPVGIVGIVFATRVSNLWKKGDYEGAEKASKIAKYLAIATVIAAIIFIASTVKVDDGTVSWGFSFGNV